MKSRTSVIYRRLASGTVARSRRPFSICSKCAVPAASHADLDADPEGAPKTALYFPGRINWTCCLEAFVLMDRNRTGYAKGRDAQCPARKLPPNSQPFNRKPGRLHH